MECIGVRGASRRRQRVDCDSVTSKLLNYVMRKKQHAPADTAGEAAQRRYCWYIDSGATTHITSDSSMLSNYNTISDRPVYMGEGEVYPERVCMVSSASTAAQLWRQRLVMLVNMSCSV